MVIGTLPELTSLYSQSYTTDKRHAVNWTKVELMSSCLQVYLVMVQQLDNTLSWSDSLIPFNYQKVVSSIPCRSVLEQDTEPLIAPDVQCAISVKMCIHPCKSLWIKASAK